MDLVEKRIAFDRMFPEDLVEKVALKCVLKHKKELLTCDDLQKGAFQRERERINISYICSAGKCSLSF